MTSNDHVKQEATATSRDRIQSCQGAQSGFVYAHKFRKVQTSTGYALICSECGLREVYG